MKNVLLIVFGIALALATVLARAAMGLYGFALAVETASFILDKGVDGAAFATVTQALTDVVTAQFEHASSFIFSG